MAFSFGFLCVGISSYKDTSHWLRAHFYFQHNVITSAKTLFPNRVGWDFAAWPVVDSKKCCKAKSLMERRGVKEGNYIG